MVEIIPEEQNKRRKMKRIDNSLRDLWDSINHTNIHVTGVPEEEEEKQGTEEIFERL